MTDVNTPTPPSFDIDGGRISRTTKGIYLLFADGRNEPVEVSESYAVQQYEEAVSQSV